MAGSPRTRERLKETETALAAAEAKLAAYEQSIGPAPELPPPPRRSIEPETLTPDSRKRLIGDMLALADDGASIDEIASEWNVEAETLVGWAEADVEFSAALGRARTRARAAMMRTFRRALNAGKNLPGALVDKLLKLYPANEAAGEDDAASLILVDTRRVDAPSTPNVGHVIEQAGKSASQARASASEAAGSPMGGAPRSAAEEGGGG